MRRLRYPRRQIYGVAEQRALLRVFARATRNSNAVDRYGGNEVNAYEEEFAAYFGVKRATAVSSGTAAVHTALGALRLEPGSEVITSAITDPGSVAPILFQMCIPVFADVEYETLNMDPASVERCVSPRTRALIVVHLNGQPCRMDALMKIARKHHLKVIEDCAQSHGAKYRGRYVGTFGDLGVFSLMSSKHMSSAGQGGVVITNSEELYWNAKRFADRGKPFNSTDPTNIFLGLNYRMTELTAAVGRVQLRKLARHAEKRRWIVRELARAFRTRGIRAFSFQSVIPEATWNPWFVMLRGDWKGLGMTKVEVIRRLQAKGVPFGSHYVAPIPHQTWIRERHTFGSSHLPWTLPGARQVSYEDACPVAERAVADYGILYFNENWGRREIEHTADCVAWIQRCAGRRTL